MSTIDSANPPQEYPDIVGARPTNPLAANFKPFIPASAHLPELTWPHLITGTNLGIIFGAITGILIAAKEMVGPLAAIGHRIEEWQTAHNPFLSGPYADLLALIPFFIICLLLYLVGRDLLLVARRKS
jgi:hypothetical protein